MWLTTGNRQSFLGFWRKLDKKGKDYTPYADFFVLTQKVIHSVTPSLFQSDLNVKGSKKIYISSLIQDLRFEINNIHYSSSANIHDRCTKNNVLTYCNLISWLRLAISNASCTLQRKYVTEFGIPSAYFNLIMCIIVYKYITMNIFFR